MINKKLILIPDSLKVNDPYITKDPRASYILEEYMVLKDNHPELPCITDDTTFADIKRYLDLAPSSEVMEILSDYDEKFLTPVKTQGFDKKKIIEIFFFFSLTVFSLLLIISVVYGIYKGELSASEIIGALIDFMGKAFGIIFGGPEVY